MFDSLVRIGGDIDYSGVCLLLSKAIEIETHKRFYKGFKAYLDSKYSRSSISHYPSSLLNDYGSPIKPEKMADLELGWSFTGEDLILEGDVYLMEYWDMLLETGRLSSSGYAIKENMPRAWRRGVELSASYRPSRSWFLASANLTLSKNEIADYTSYVPYEDYSAVKAVSYGRTTMLLSPSVTGMCRLCVLPSDGTSIWADLKHVGKQYLDNSGREAMAVPAYTVLNLGASKDFPLGHSLLTISLFLNNALDSLYYASGWRWESYDPAADKIYYGVGVYPQAPRNWSLKTSLSF